MGEGDLFDIFGMNGATPTADPGGLTPVVDVTPTGAMQPSLDGIHIDPSTGALSDMGGNPIPAEQEAALRSAYGLSAPGSMQPPAGTALGSADLSQVSGQPTPISDKLRDTIAGITPEEAASIDTPNPSPGALSKIAGALSNPSTLAKLMVTLGTGGLTALMYKLMANPATAPSASRIAAQMQQGTNPIFSEGQSTVLNSLTGVNPAIAGPGGPGGAPGAPAPAPGSAPITTPVGTGTGAQDLNTALRSGYAGNSAYQQALLNAITTQAGPEAQVRMAALGKLNSPNYGDPLLGGLNAQAARVLAGQYSNPLLDEQAKQNQETLQNQYYKMGGADNLTQSTAGQRAQMYQNLQNAILRQQDQRSFLSSMLPQSTAREGAAITNQTKLAGSGLALNPNIGLASYQPQSSPVLGLPSAQTSTAQTGALLANAALAQYQAQSQNNRDNAALAGNVVNNLGTGLQSAIT